MNLVRLNCPLLPCKDWKPKVPCILGNRLKKKRVQTNLFPRAENDWLSRLLCLNNFYVTLLWGNVGSKNWSSPGLSFRFHMNSFPAVMVLSSCFSVDHHKEKRSYTHENYKELGLKESDLNQVCLLTKALPGKSKGTYSLSWKNILKDNRSPTRDSILLVSDFLDYQDKSEYHILHYPFFPRSIFVNILHWNQIPWEVKYQSPFPVLFQVVS